MTVYHFVGIKGTGMSPLAKFFMILGILSKDRISKNISLHKKH